MQASNFTLKLVAVIYIRKQKGKSAMDLFCGLEGFWSFALYIQNLRVFFFKSACIYLKAKFKVVAVLGQKSSLQSSATAVWNDSTNWRQNDSGDCPMT